MRTPRLDDLIAHFIQRLREKDLQVRAGAALAEIQAFERKNAVQLPIEMTEFYLGIDGMDSAEIDPESHIRMYGIGDLQPLTELLPEYSRGIPNAQHAFVVADYLMWSLGYAVWLSDTILGATPVFLVGDGNPIRVSASFEEFIALFAHNSPALLPTKSLG